MKMNDNGNGTFRYFAVTWLYVITKIKTCNVYFQVFTYSMVQMPKLNKIQNDLMYYLIDIYMYCHLLEMISKFSRKSGKSSSSTRGKGSDGITSSWS